MRIELKCSCGASVIFEDNRCTYIKNGGEADEKGRKFLIEVRADEWQDKHSVCLDAAKNK